MPQDSTLAITLAIHETGVGAQSAFLFHVLMDREVVASNRALTPADSRAVRELSARYAALFEQAFEPRIAEDNLKALGSRLFELWLGASWSKVSRRFPPDSRRCLVIASELAEVLNLPWELLRPPGGDFLGLDLNFSIRRLPRADGVLTSPTAPLPPRPLRILFMACAPQGQPPLDYELEEETLLSAIRGAGDNVVLESGELGTFEELRQRINDFKPHVVHLSGHAILGDDGLGYFAFEDEAGETDRRSSEDIGKMLFSGGGAQCAFISACQAARAPQAAALGGICQQLMGAGVPLAVGWAASVQDPSATRFAATFYDTLAAGQSVDRAVVQARQAVRQASEEGDLSWTLPVLYTATTKGLVFDPDPRREPEPPTRRSVAQFPLPGMTEGYAEHFVGRRREMQRLLPALHDGALQVVLITGLAGAGKSALATRLARKLEAAGFTPIPVPGSKETPLGVDQLLQACGDAFLAAGLRDAHSVVGEEKLHVDARLRYVVTALNQHPFVLVLDNFEAGLDEHSRRILDPELAGFYSHLLTYLSGRSRALVTSRYRPADVPELPPRVHEQPLADFPYASSLKLLLRDADVERRYYGGKLSPELLGKLRRLLGGAPRFLCQIRQVLRTISDNELRLELEAVELPPGSGTADLQQARDRYCEDIFAGRLYQYLSVDSQRALCRAAVYGVAVNLEGLAAVAGVSTESLKAFTREWQDRALAYVEGEPGAGGLWTVYGLLRGWLLQPERLSLEERRKAHQRAGDFLVGLQSEGREEELALSRGSCLLEARAQYLAAGACDRAAAVTGIVSHSLMRRGLYDDVIRLNSEVLVLGEHPLPMGWIAGAHLAQADFDTARTWYQRCLEAAGAHMPGEAAAAWRGLGNIDRTQGNHGAARESLHKALEIEQRTGDWAGEAATWHELASVDLDQGRYEAAREGLQKALEARQRLGDRAGEAAAWHQLAMIDEAQGYYEAARKKLLRSLEIKRQVGDWVGEAAAWHALAAIDVSQGNYDAAREKVRNALTTWQQTGGLVGQATAWFTLGAIDLEEGDHAGALAKFQQALGIQQRVGDRSGEADTWQRLGLMDLKRGRHNAARESFQKVLEIQQQLGDRRGEASAWHNLGSVDLEEGNYRGAAQKLVRALGIERELGNREGEASTLHELARIDFRLGDYEMALERFKNALEIRQEVGGRAGEAAAFYQLGLLAIGQGRHAEGTRLVALCFLIDRAIGHGDTERDFRNLCTVAHQLGYTNERLHAVLDEAWDGYGKDRGRQFLRAAFPGKWE